MRRPVVPPVAAILLVAGALSVAGCSDDGDPAPRAEEPQTPPALARTCERVGRASRVAVLCPAEDAGQPSAPADRRLEVIHEDLDPDPCAYLVNVQQPDHDAAGVRPSHLILGGSCTRLPLGRPGARWAVDPLQSLRAVATPPLQSGQTPDQVTLRRPMILRRLRVRDRAGMLIQFDPRPPGGLHGGHYGLAWNEARRGYLLSGHYATGDERRRPRADEVAALLGFAARLRRVPAAGR